MTGRYNIIQSKETKKYGVSDSDNNIVIPLEHDFILDIIDDKWVVVAKETEYMVQKCTWAFYDSVTYRRYLYGLMDISGRWIKQCDYDILWVTDGDIITWKCDMHYFDQKFHKNNRSHWSSINGTVCLEGESILYSNPLIAAVLSYDEIKDKKCIKVFDAEINEIKRFYTDKEYRQWLKNYKKEYKKLTHGPNLLEKFADFLKGEKTDERNIIEPKRCTDWYIPHNYELTAENIATGIRRNLRKDLKIVRREVRDNSISDYGMSELMSDITDGEYKVHNNPEQYYLYNYDLLGFENKGGRIIVPVKFKDLTPKREYRKRICSREAWCNDIGMVYNPDEPDTDAGYKHLYL